MRKLLRVSCDVRESCIKRDSVTCSSCIRSNRTRKDFFEQDKEVVNSRFRELVKARFNKTN